MSGVKGRSGRRPLSVEMLRKATIDKAWSNTHDILNSPTHPRQADASIQLVVKDMVSKEQSSVDMRATISAEEQSILDRYTKASRLPQS